MARAGPVHYDASGGELAAILLVSTPVFLIGGTIGMVVARSVSPLALMILHPGWAVFWGAILIAMAALVIGSYWTIRAQLTGPIGDFLGIVVVMLLPITFVAVGLALFTGRAITRRDSAYAVSEEDLPLALDLLTAMTDAMVLLIGVGFGLTIVILGGLLDRAAGKRQVLGAVGLLLGAAVLVLNFALLFTGEATPLFHIGIVSVILASLWLVPFGVLMVRDARIGTRSVGREWL